MTREIVTKAGLEATVYASKIAAKSSKRDRKGRGGRGGHGSRMRTGAVEHGVGMGCAARKSQKPALEIGGGPAVHRFLVSACRSARTTAKSGAAMVGGFDRWL